MTDNEIIKALDEAELFLRNRTMDGMSLELNEYDIGILKDISKVCARAYDEINRQKAEIERLTTLADLGNMRANDYRAMRDKLKAANAEIERLKKGWEADVILTANVKAEAIKEFAERLKGVLLEEDGYGFEIFNEVEFFSAIDNLIKEMVGDV